MEYGTQTWRSVSSPSPHLCTEDAWANIMPSNKKSVRKILIVKSEVVFYSTDNYKDKSYLRLATRKGN
jgi:hypothetical protein